MSKTSLGLEENVEAALSYVLLWITGIVFYILERESEFVRFHAMQSIVVFLSLTVLQKLVLVIPLLGAVFSLLVSVLGFILWILLIVKAYQGEFFKLPIAGEVAERLQ